MGKDYLAALDARDRMRRYLASPKYASEIAGIPENGDWFKADVEMAYEAFRDAPIYYLDGQVLDFVRSAAAALPLDMAFLPQVLPSFKGLLYLGHPLYTVPRNINAKVPTIPIAVNALSWSAVVVPAKETPLRSVSYVQERAVKPADIGWVNTGIFAPNRQNIPALAMVYYVSAEESLAEFIARGDDPDTFRASVEQWNSNDPEGAGSRFVVTTRFLLAFWLFCQQRILVSSHRKADRATVRRMGLPLGTLAPEVQVITLRRSEKKEGTDQHHDVEWHCRWLVRGHWRRLLGKTVWVRPYIKGPEEKPLRLAKETVYNVSR